LVKKGSGRKWYLESVCEKKIQEGNVRKNTGPEKWKIVLIAKQEKGGEKGLKKKQLEISTAERKGGHVGLQGNTDT